MQRSGAAVEKPGEFTDTGTVVSIMPRGPGGTRREWSASDSSSVPPPPGIPAPRIPGVRRAYPDHVVAPRAWHAGDRPPHAQAPVLASISPGEREKRRAVALTAIQPRMVQAVPVDRGSPVLRASRHRSDRDGRRGVLLRHGAPAHAWRAAAPSRSSSCATCSSRSSTG